MQCIKISALLLYISHIDLLKFGSYYIIFILGNVRKLFLVFLSHSTYLQLEPTTKSRLVGQISRNINRCINKLYNHFMAFYIHVTRQYFCAVLYTLRFAKSSEIKVNIYPYRRQTSI